MRKIIEKFLKRQFLVKEKMFSKLGATCIRNTDPNPDSATQFNADPDPEPHADDPGPRYLVVLGW